MRSHRAMRMMMWISHALAPLDWRAVSLFETTRVKVANCGAKGAATCIFKDPTLCARGLGCRPGALDIVEHGADIVVAESVAKADHVNLITLADEGGGAELDDREQLVVGVVPSMAARVVRLRFLSHRRPFERLRGSRNLPLAISSNLAHRC